MQWALGAMATGVRWSLWKLKVGSLVYFKNHPKGRSKTVVLGICAV